MNNTALTIALDLARRQLDAAQSGDFDRVLALLDDYQEACSLAATQMSSNDEPNLRTLIATNARIGTLVAHAAHDAQSHVSKLQERRGLASAYLAGDGPSAITAARSA